MLIQTSSDTTDCENQLVPVVTHAHVGDSLDVFYYYNNNLSSNDLSLYSVTPEGKRQYHEMTNRKEDHCAYLIEIRENGLYHFIGEQHGYYGNDANGRCFRGTFEDNPEAVSATRYLHYAHTVLQSGSSVDAPERARVLLPPLCIVPESWNSFWTGEVFAFTLYFMDKPLPLYDIDIFIWTETGEAIHDRHITSGDGRMLYPIKVTGKYLVVVRYTSPESEEGIYYDTIYTYSFWFKVEN